MIRWLVTVAVLVTAPPAQGQVHDYAAADSADIVDDALAGVDPADVADVTEALEETARERSRRTARALRFEAVRGHRGSERLLAGARGAAVGWHHTDDATTGWIDVRGGLIERVTVGGLRVRCGQGLVLGATRSRFGSPGRRGAAGLVVTPSLSTSRVTEGAALTVRAGAIRTTAAAWQRNDGGWWRWVSASALTRSGAVALSAGSLASTTSSRARRGVSVSGARAFSRSNVSGEVARVGTFTLALARVTLETAGTWTAEVFTGALDASGGVVEFDGEPGRERGGSLRGRETVGGWTTTLSLYAIRRHGPGVERRRRRIDGRGVLDTNSGIRYDVSLRYDRDEERRLPSAVLAGVVDRVALERARLRLRLDVPAGAGMSLRYQVRALVEPHRRPGFLSAMEVRARATFGELRVSVTNVSLPGDGGIVARPGIAGYETVAVSDRRGSDLSARATIRLHRHADMTLYAGAPWRRPPRYLVAVNTRL